MISAKHAAFLAEHRWAVLTSLRASGAPVSSVVAYAQEGDTFVVSTPGATFKRASIAADPRVNLCVINNAEPFKFVAIEGTALVQQEELLAPTRAVFERLTGTGIDEPENLAQWLQDQQRVILRITPQRAYGV